MAKKQEILVDFLGFSVENLTTHKIQKSAIKHTFKPQKRQEMS